MFPLEPQRQSADEHLQNLTRMAVDYFMQSRLAGSGKRMVADKSPLLTPDDVKEIHDLYPETKSNPHNPGWPGRRRLRRPPRLELR